ncbi:MAG: DUF3750 domain-containing protein [Planctomycetes bacterium]|nr:DUF3750 domain-containing protein [Planctomycetota bacterium]
MSRCACSFLHPAVWLTVLAGCAVRPSTVAEQEHLVVVKSVRLPDRDWLPWFTRFAEHAWVDVKSGSAWHRVEWNAHLDEVWVAAIDARVAMLDERWDRGVAVHAVHCGDAAALLGAAILQTARGYPDVLGYQAWPGPNSNSFVVWLSRQVPGFSLQLPPNAVGKDFTPWLRIGGTTTGTGVAIDTAVLGAQVGLAEGVELHLLGLTAGVGLWPPQLKLPFLPAIPAGWFSPFGAVREE